jgi:hypothetical protein
MQGNDLTSLGLATCQTQVYIYESGYPSDPTSLGSAMLWTQVYMGLAIHQTQYS